MKSRKSRSAVKVKPQTPAQKMCRLRLTVGFDGSRYFGWQFQKQASVQQEVESALARLFPSKPALHSSSRTDTGVHAMGMVAHFDIPCDERRWSSRKLVLAINAHLPPDIRVRQVANAKADFHARFSARAKQYRYFVWNHASHHPLWQRWTWHVPRRLDLKAMRRAARLLIGTHDFRAFSATPGYP